MCMEWGFTGSSIFARVMALYTSLDFFTTFSCQRNSYIFQRIWMKLGISKIMMSRCAWSEDLRVRRFLQELWPFTLGLFHNCFLSTQLLLHFSTDLDETWHKARWWWCLDVHEVRIYSSSIFAELWQSVYYHLQLNGGLLSDGLQWWCGGRRHQFWLAKTNI
jgi:hypothetical protein